jgi:cell division protein FtsZ
MQDAGPALIGLGRGSGEQRATDAAREAIASPLLEARIDGAHNLLFNISGPPDLQLHEVRAAADEIRAAADADANVIFGASLGEPVGGDVHVTLIATGLNGHGNGHGRTETELDEKPDALPSGAPPDRREPKRRSRAISAPPDPSPGSASKVPAGIVTLAPAEPDQGLEPRHALVEGEDIDVPSFLRRKGPTSNGS